MKKLASDLKKLKGMQIYSKLYSYHINFETADLICSILKRIRFEKMPEKYRDEHTENLEAAKYDISKIQDFEKFDKSIRSQSSLYAALKIAISAYKKNDQYFYGLDDVLEKTQNWLLSLVPVFINIETTNRLNYKLW